MMATMPPEWKDRRRERDRRVLAGYVSGPAAPVEATARALAKAGTATALILVEGISDQIAVETAAHRRGRDLDAEHVTVVPIGGAHALGRVLGELDTRVLAGLCDLREAGIFRRGLGPARTHVCVDDLEDELIRAVGTDVFAALIDAQGDLGSFHALRNQPAWRDRSVDDQMRRFLTSGSRRKARYARLLVEAAVDRDVLPRPLDDLLSNA